MESLLSLTNAGTGEQADVDFDVLAEDLDNPEAVARLVQALKEAKAAVE